MASRRHGMLLLAAASFGLSISPATAQTNGTWAVDVGTVGGSWSVSGNWADGVVPDNGGTVQFTTLPTFSSAPLSIWQDLSTVSVSKFNFDTLITYYIRPAATSPTSTITLTGDATIHHSVPGSGALSTTLFGHLFQIGIAGSNGLTKTGPGIVTLWAANSYSGGTRIEDGVLAARSVGDAAFGAAGASISIDGGTLRVASGSMNSSRSIVINAGGGTIDATTTGQTILNGAVSGSGNLYKTGSGSLVLGAANSYQGETQIFAGTLNLNSNGALNNTTAVTINDVVILDNASTNLTNRVNDSATLRMHGSTMLFTGNASSASSETFGATTFSRGTTTISAAAGAGQSAALSFGTLTRDTAGAAFFRGTGLGSTLGANASNITFANTPTLVGGGGTTPTNVSIIPWAYGNTTATASLNAATNTFVTYGANGVRPLDIATEYATSIGVASATDNVRINASEAVNASTSINALLITTGGGLTGNGTVSIGSGALLNLNPNTVISPSVDFGSAEGVIIAPASITFNGAISGTGGLTKHGAGTAIFAAANTYTGTTTIGGGTALFTSSVPSGSASAFGQSTGSIVLAPAGTGTGGTTARLAYGGTTAASFDRNLTISGRTATNNPAIVPGFGVATGQTLTMNGSITLDGSPLALIGTATSTLILNGDITGNGGPLTAGASAGGSVIQLNGDNTFNGDVELGTSIWQVGSDTAFGTGTLKLIQTSSSPTIQAVGAARLVPNDVSYPGLLAATYWQVGGAQDISFTGSINLSGSYTHNISNSALTTYGGVLHTGGFTKTGAGTLVLSNNNIYTGSTTISTGVLRATNSGALGTTAAPTIVAAGAMLEMRNNALTSEPVTLNGTGLPGLGALNSASGNNSVGNVTLATSSTISVEAGDLAAANITGTGAANLNKVGAGTLTANRVSASGLAVDAGVLKIAAGRSPAKLSTATSLTIAPSASFDLGDNDLQVNYTGGSPAVAIRGYLQTGYNAGSWNGSGLISSVAALTPNTALGYIDNGVSVSVIYTAAGDANLDRKVNTLDFNELAGNFGASSGAVWTGGDFDYDGDVDSIDFTLLSSAYGTIMPTPAPLGAVVPEPSALALGLTGLILRRRQR